MDVPCKPEGYEWKQPVRILDYLHWDGDLFAENDMRCFHVRVDSLETAKQLVEDFGDVGLDKFWAAEEYKPGHKCSPAWLALLPVVGLWDWGYRRHKNEYVEGGDKHNYGSVLCESRGR